jgi:filamentous hemagglutinin family protein
MKFSVLLPIVLLATPAWAQPIQPANDGLATVVTPQGDRFDIHGGVRSGNNLFHSFSQFGLGANQSANFLTDPALQNVLARVTGGQPSLIQGMLQVSGSNANLFLLNPAGIVFGPTASLNVPASFTATTANSIGFGNSGWFTLQGTPTATGDPTAFAFTALQPGAIVNAAQLATPQNLTLLGGTVLSTGRLTAPGTVTIAAVPGQNLVRLNVPGSLLGLEFQPLAGDTNQSRSLAELLTGGELSNASGVSVGADGTIRLRGTTVNPGDAIAAQVTAGNATLFAAQDLKLADSQLRTQGDLTLFANRTVWIRDSVANPFLAFTGGNLTIQGNQGIDILALNHLTQTPFVSRGKLSLISDGIISGDAHFRSGKGTAILNLQGRGGRYFSYFDPIHSTDGDFSMGDYNGTSLKVEAGGNLTIQGSITITGSDTVLNTFCASNPCTPEAILLGNQSALILRAGVSTLTEPITQTAFFTSPEGRLLIQGNVQVMGDNARIILNARGDIQADASLMTSGSNGVVDLVTTSGQIAIANQIKVQGAASRVTISSASDLLVTSISTEGGSVVANANGNILINSTNTSTNSFFVHGGSISLNAKGRLELGDLLAGSSTRVYAGLGHGSVLLESGADVVVSGEIAPGGASTVVSSAGSVNLTGGSAIETWDGSLAINASQALSADRSISTQAGNLDLVGGQINFGAVPLTTTRGRLTLTAIDQLTVGNLRTEGGAVSAVSQGSTASLGNVQTSSVNGGAVQLSGRNGLSVGTIDTSALFTGGAINLASDGNVGIQWAKTSGTQGGNIDIFARGSFRATSATNVLLGNYSLATDGLLQGGSITIHHRLNDPMVPFTVGNAAVNGTAGGILAGLDNQILPLQVFPSRYTQGKALNSVTISGMEPIEVPQLPTETPPIIAPFPSDKKPPIEVQSSDTINRPPVVGTQEIPPLVVQLAETNFAKEFRDQLGLSQGQIVTLPETQAIASTIEQKTGVRPAFIYVNFVPTSQANQEVLELILVTAKGKPTRHVVYAATRPMVQALTQRFFAGITDRTSDDYFDPARDLYQVLIQPLEPQLQRQGITNLVFLMEKGLRSLPIAALHDGQRFLIEKYSLGIMPSLSLTDIQYTDIKTAPLLAMGASKFESLTPLPAVPVELAAITRQWRQGQALLNESFTIDNLLAQRRKQSHGILHLATHSEFQPGSPGNSYIQFWDKQLRLNEIRSLGLNNPPVELLVLSACRTAIGDAEAELGFAGLAAQSGVRSALASLWYVSDEGTLALMSQFYRYLADPQVRTRSEALRQAQIALAQGNWVLANGAFQQASAVPANADVVDLSHPYYWAAFTLIGNPW